MSEHFRPLAKREAAFRFASFIGAGDAAGSDFDFIRGFHESLDCVQ
jgi:hypothetical protein